MNQLLLFGGWLFLSHFLAGSGTLAARAKWVAAPSASPVTRKVAIVPAGKRAAIVEAVRATPGVDCTLVDITMTGVSVPTVASEPGRLVVTLPNARSDSRLAERIATGGLVSRLNIESPPSSTPSVRLNFTL